MKENVARVVKIDEYKEKIEEENDFRRNALAVMAELELTPMEQSILYKLIGQDVYDKAEIAKLEAMKVVGEREQVIANVKKKFLDMWPKIHKNQPILPFKELNY